MTPVEIAEVLGSLLGSLFAFGTLLYLLLLLRTLYQHKSYSLVLECLTVCVGFIFVRQIFVVLLAVGLFSDQTPLARNLIRYFLTGVGVAISIWVFVRMARWQFEAQEAVQRLRQEGSK